VAVGQTQNKLFLKKFFLIENYFNISLCLLGISLYIFTKRLVGKRPNVQKRDKKKLKFMCAGRADMSV
jgi:hypothetical protein